MSARKIQHCWSFQCCYKLHK